MVASALIEMADSDELHLHLIHPRPTPFSKIMSIICQELNVKPVPYSEWLDLLLERAEKIHGHPDAENAMEQNPALRLTDFFMTAQGGEHTEPIGMVRLGDSKAREVAPTLGERARRLEEEDVRGWLRMWKKYRFLSE